MSDTTERTHNWFIETFSPALLVIGVIFVGFIMFWTAPKKGDVVIINCSLSEISPDFTTEMREACRQARIKNSQDHLQKPK